jgi:hypothetical protein
MTSVCLTKVSLLPLLLHLKALQHPTRPSYYIYKCFLLDTLCVCALRFNRSVREVKILTQNKKCPNGAVGEDARYKSKSYTHAHSPALPLHYYYYGRASWQPQWSALKLLYFLKQQPLIIKVEPAERALTAAAGLL